MSATTMTTCRTGHCVRATARPSRMRRMLRRLPQRAALVAILLAGLALAADGERWLLRDAPLQSIEYVAATCAADALYGSVRLTTASCNNPGIDTGKSL